MRASLKSRVAAFGDRTGLAAVCAEASTVAIFVLVMALRRGAVLPPGASHQPYAQTDIADGLRAQRVSGSSSEELTVGRSRNLFVPDPGALAKYVGAADVRAVSLASLAVSSS